MRGMSIGKNNEPILKPIMIARAIILFLSIFISSLNSVNLMINMG